MSGDSDLDAVIVSLRDLEHEGRILVSKLRRADPRGFLDAIRRADQAFLEAQIPLALLPEPPHVAARLAAATHARNLRLRAELRRFEKGTP